MAKTGYKRRKHQNILDIIGENIRIYRLENNLSQDKLATLCEMESSSISRYENAEVDISASSVAIIAEALKLEPNKLLIPVKKTEANSK